APSERIVCRGDIAAAGRPPALRRQLTDVAAQQDPLQARGVLGRAIVTVVAYRNVELPVRAESQCTCVVIFQPVLNIAQHVVAGRRVDPEEAATAVAQIALHRVPREADAAA